MMDDDTSRRRELMAARRIASLIDDAESDLDSMAADLTQLYRDDIPVYDLVARDEIERNTRAVLHIALRQVRSDSPSVNVAEMTELVRAWSDQRIPLELVAHSIQVGARMLSKKIRVRATDQGLPLGAVDEIADIVWQWATSYSAAVTAVMAERAVSRAEQQSDFLRRLVNGTASPSAFAEHGIAADHEYRVACADNDDPAITSEVRATLRLRCTTGDLRVFDAVVDGYYTALLPSLPADLDITARVAVGPPELPSDAGASYRQARRILDIATKFDRAGVVDLAKIGALTLLAADDDMARSLAAIHLAPLRDRGDAGREIADTVATYLQHHRRVDETAAAMFLHRNTVRNRVTRFSALTGLDLDCMDDLVLTWWLLNRR